MFSVKGDIAKVKSQKYIITTHARERFVSRFSSARDEYSHIEECRSSCPTCFELKNKIAANRHHWDNLICEKLVDAEDVRIFQNDTEFMSFMYERYGYNRFHFFVSGYIVFITVEERGMYCLKTCMDGNWRINGSLVLKNFINRPKYKRKTIAS